MAVHLPLEKLKELLVGSHLVSENDFNAVLEEAKRTGQDAAAIFISRGFISEDYLYQLYTDFFKTPLVKLRGRPIKKAILSLIPEEVARTKRVAVFDKDEAGRISLAMEDPSDLETIGFVEKYTGSAVKIYLTTPKDLNYVFSLYGKEIVEDFQKAIEESVIASAD